MIHWISRQNLLLIVSWTAGYVITAKLNCVLLTLLNEERPTLRYLIIIRK
jgi:hypothetical protein